MSLITIDTLIRSKRKTIALVVEKDATLTVRAPFRVSLQYLHNLVIRKESWIIAKKKTIQTYQQSVREKSFLDGEVFLYLGEEYMLKVYDGASVLLNEKEHQILFPRIFLTSKSLSKEKLIAFYKKKAKEIIEARAKLYVAMTGWRYCAFKITSAETRWGSCSERGSINFTWRLVMAREGVIDYVVVHELAHIHIKNHSRTFWNAVETVIPSYKKHVTWLKENRGLLVV